jgi:glycosyltransferase involved in cell wall biosynthesis
LQRLTLRGSRLGVDDLARMLDDVVGHNRVPFRGRVDRPAIEPRIGGLQYIEDRRPLAVRIGGQEGIVGRSEQPPTVLVLAGVPKVILSGRNLNPSHFELYQPYMDPAYKALARVPSVSFVNNSRAGADDYADWIGIPRSRISVVHNGVDFGNRRRLSALQARGLRDSLGIAAEAFVVGGVFRLEAEKRPLLWVDTAARVAEKLPDARFLIYGQGRMHQRLIRAANRAGLARRLILPGLTSDVVSAMSIMDVLLLTSSGEGLPNVLLEAQWSGTPVVTTDVGGAKEAIDPDVTGWAIKTDAPHELADRITWLHGNPQVRSAALDRGPAFVRTNFSVERMVSEITKLYVWS